MSELSKLEQAIVAGIGTDTLSVAMEATDAFDSYCDQVRRLQAIIDDIAAHLTVAPERNMFYLKLGRTEYGAFIKPEDYMDDFPFMVNLRPIAEMKAAALLAGMPTEDSE